MKENFGIILDCWKVNIYIVLKKNSWRDKMLSKYGPIGRKFTPIHSHNLKKKKKKRNSMLQALNLQRHI